MDVGNWVRDLALVFQSGRVRAARARRFNAAVKSHGVANVDVLEDRLLLTADFGDAPDTTAATGVNDYQTLAANGGPSHVIDTTQTTLYLGGGVDGEAGTQQSLAANLDNLFTTGGRNDEDGVMSSLDLTATVGASPKITLSATNTTGAAATLYGWIDYNHNGVFENATERAQIAVPTGTTAGRFTLQFSKIVGDVAGGTYARFRLSSDAAAANSNGAATGGEVEDYQFIIMNRVKTPVTVSKSVRVADGVKGGPKIHADDGYGYIGLVPIGDLDGNGVGDVVIGASGLPDLATNRGAVYVLLRNADGSVSSSKRITSEVNGGPAIPEGEHFGAGGTSLGDIDGDGVTDIAISSIDGEENAFVYILNLKPDGSVKSHRKLSSGVDGFPQLATGDGAAVLASLGDIDGDGISDIAVGAPGADGTGTDRGAIHILRMNADGTVKGSTMIDASGEWNPASADGDDFGEDITVLGDIDGNGVTDLGVMSEILDSDDSTTTVINILQLNVDGTVKQATRLVSAAGGDPSIANVDILTGLTAIGDIDGDGINDLAVSGQEFPERDPENLLANLFDSTNVINLLSLNSNGSVKRSITIPGPDTVGNNLFTNFTVLAKLDDANGDLNLAVGIPFYDVPFTENELENAKSSLTVLTLTPKIENTAAPTVPVLNAISTTPGQNPAISWAADRHADSYEIWLRNQTTGQVVLNSVSTTSNSFTPPAGVGNFVVWVRAVNEIGKSSWSRSSTFVSKSPVTAIATPDGMSRRPELKWNSLPGAAKYEIWLSDTRTRSIALVNKRIKSDNASFTISADLADGRYHFQVRGIAADGTTGAWSAVIQFSVHTRTAIEPVRNQFTLRPRIEWNPVAGAVAYDLYISHLNSNDAPITLQVDALSDLTFVPTSNLAAGNYRAWVRPVAQDGKHGSWSPHIDFSSGISVNLAVSATEVKVNQFMDLTIADMPDAKYLDIWIDDPGPGTTTAAFGLSRHDFSTTITHKFEEQGKYRIWVRLVADDGSTSAWSIPAEVIVRGKPQTIAVQNQLESTDRPRISWTPVRGAVSNQIRVRNIDTEEVRSFTTGRGTSIFNLSQPLPLGRYLMEVRAISQDGIEGEWATTNVPYVSRPVLILQATSSTTDKTPQFQWNRIDGAVRYDVVIRNITTGRVEIAVRDNSATNYTSTPLPIGDFELWVCAYGSEQVRSEWSSTQFSIVEPRPIVVADGPGIPLGMTGQVLNWTFEVEADHYEVKISSYAGVPVLTNQEVAGTKYTLTSLLPRSGYLVWVRAVYADSSKSPWSDPETFFVY